MSSDVSLLAEFHMEGTGRYEVNPFDNGVTCENGLNVATFSSRADALGFVSCVNLHDDLVAIAHAVHAVLKCPGHEISATGSAVAALTNLCRIVAEIGARS